MHIVSLYRKRSRELHGGKGKGCWKVWPGSGLYFKTLIGFFFNFFINFLSFHVILHYNIYSLITNSTCTDKYQTNYKFNKLLLERLIITFTSNGIREFVPPCRLLFIISARKLVVSLNFLSIWIFWAVFICSFSILRNSQLESDVCHLPYVAGDWPWVSTESNCTVGLFGAAVSSFSNSHKVTGQETGTEQPHSAVRHNTDSVSCATVKWSSTL